MGKKFILNVFLNIGLIAMVFIAVSSFKKDEYPTFIGTLFIIVLLLVFKIKLLKQVKNLTQNKP